MIKLYYRQYFYYSLLSFIIFAVPLPLVIQQNVHTKIIPFTIDVTENAHQIPSSPSNAPPKMIASGILALVNQMLITLHKCVFPNPDNAPTVISSTAINASLTPMIVKYPIAIIIAFGSWKKISAIAFG